MKITINVNNFDFEALYEYARAKTAKQDHDH